MKFKAQAVLPDGDRTLSNYKLPECTWIERMKRPLRKLIYPIYNALNHHFLHLKYSRENFKPDLWLWGQRGNDFERQRGRVSRYVKLKGAHILVAGCGTARDIESWMRYAPGLIKGIDWFCYQRAWGLWTDHYEKKSPNVKIEFAQADLAQMGDCINSSYDVVSSDAVFEHLTNLPEVLNEFYRILKPGGILYATFGPLWFGFGGDHISSYDSVLSGYNHLILSEIEYKRYLDKLGEYTHSEHDGRTWVEHNLFSRLKPREYLSHLEQVGFRRLFVSAILEPRAIQCLENPKFDKQKVAKYDFLDLRITGMTIIYKK